VGLSTPHTQPTLGSTRPLVYNGYRVFPGGKTAGTWGCPPRIRSRPSAPPGLLCTMGTGSFPGVKRPGRGTGQPPSFCAEVKERVELCIYPPPLWALVACCRPNFTLRQQSSYKFNNNNNMSTLLLEPLSLPNDALKGSESADTGCF